MPIRQNGRPACREITGPTPHSVALRARLPSTIPPDFLILDRRRQETALAEVSDFTRYQKACEVRNQWEISTERRTVHRTTERRVQDAVRDRLVSLEDRRDRLRSLLETEEKELLSEMEVQEETALERQAKMRERARLLKERRENERGKEVLLRLDQLFREQSEELRTAQARQLQHEVCAERAAQLHSREKERLQRLEEERFFAQLWEADRQAKEERAELEGQQQRSSARQQRGILCAQMEAAEQRRVQSRQLKEEQAQLLVHGGGRHRGGWSVKHWGVIPCVCLTQREQQQLQLLEEQRERGRRWQEQQRMRGELDRALRLKMRRLAREQQEELAQDMRILEELLQEHKDESHEQERRKQELQREQHSYRQYLAEQAEEQRRLEVETEQLMEEELERAWQRRVEQYRAGQEARNRLMKEVMDTRRQQIQEKFQENMAKQAQLEQEREDLSRNMQKHQQEEEQEKESLRRARQEYRADLLSQIRHQRQIRQSQQAELERESQQRQAFQEQQQSRLQEILTRPTSHLRPIHPFRRMAGPLPAAGNEPACTEL